MQTISVPEMTAQEIFDKVATHLFAQGKRAMDKFQERCEYRGADGTSCAVGCLIPDAAYRPNMEGEGILSLFALFPDVFGPWGKHKHMLCALQHCHDVERFWKSSDAMRKGLRNVAVRYDLSSEILNTLSFADR